MRKKSGVALMPRVPNRPFCAASQPQLGACAFLSDQPRDQVRIRVGPEPLRAERAEPYAALYASYAMISSLAYTGRQKLNRDHCPEYSLLDRQNDAQAIAWMRSLNG